MTLPAGSITVYTDLTITAMSKAAFRKTNGFVGVVFLFLVGSGLRAEELPLEQAIQLALQHNVEIANTTLDVSKAKERSAAFRTSLFPKLSTYMLGSEQLQPVNITVARGTLGIYPGIGPIPAQNVNYTTPMQPTGFILGRIAQPLSSIYRTRLTLKALDFSTQLAQQKTRSKRQDVVRNVKQLYYNIEQVQSSLAAMRETIRLYKEVERLTGDYVAKQTALEAELLQAQASLAEAEQSELALSNQEAKQKEQLNDLLGRDVLTPFTVVAMSEAVNSESDLTAARQRALAQRPEIQQARLKTMQSEDEMRAKRAEYIPEVSAEFNSITLLNFNSFLPGGTYSVGVSLSWEPFDWGRKKHEVAEKRDTVLQDKNTQAETERKVIMDIDDKYRQMQQGWSKLRSVKLSQRAALEALRVNKNQYEVQAVLLKVVFQSQATLAQANSDYQHALADYWSAKAEFEHALGEDQ
ncbi:MAG: TolC family protein [Acidobacteriaceae bacterium]|nr:TolC family protein [Acidobacteriaceae bacterium]